MNQITKDKIFAELDEQCLMMSHGKGADYASDKDVLDNFKRNGERLGLSPFQIWSVYFNKHIDSINNAVKNNPNNPSCVTEKIDGRIIDAITYLKLLQCLLVDVRSQDVGASEPTLEQVETIVERRSQAIRVTPAIKSDLDEDVPF